jgi:hypothetical protein
MNFLTINQSRNEYNSGKILENRQNTKYVYIFSLCSRHFTSTVKRAKKGNQYRLNNPYWVQLPGGLFTKLKMIICKDVVLVRKKISYVK